jgi:hypothetical protein
MILAELFSVNSKAMDVVIKVGKVRALNTSLMFTYLQDVLLVMNNGHTQR